MTDTTPHRRIAAAISRERAAWRALVDEVGRDRLEEPGPMGEWSFRDLAAHLLGWRERTIARLEAAAAGRPEPPEPWPAGMDDDDMVNDWLQEQYAGRSSDEVLQAVDMSYERLGAALAALPEATLTDPAALPWLDGEAAADVDWLSHYHDEHETSVRDWLARRD